MLLWLAVGVRQIDPTKEFGVVDRAILGPRKVEGRFTLAPPGAARLHRYPIRAIELPLPQAEELQLPGTAGTRYGFRGWMTVRARPEAWDTVHAAAAGRGIDGAILEGVRAAGAGLDAGVHRGLGLAALGEELETRLRAELAQRGIDLRRVELDGLDYLTAEAGAGRDPGTRLLVIGLDGADWAILDPLLERGRLPNLAALVGRGARGKLLTISPMLSPVIWTTIATGVEPSRHGILDFLVQDETGADRQPVTSAQRREPTVWEILNRAGIRTGVVGWWATWPADPVDGYLVSDRVAYQLFDYESDPEDATGKTWPPDLYDRVRERLVPPDDISWDRVAPYLDDTVADPERLAEPDRELLDEFRTLLASGDSYVAVADDLRREFAPRFEAVYLEGTDTVGHLFMRFRPPPLPGVPADRRTRFGDFVDRYYETADAMLGRLLSGRGDDWTVMVLSDHGFASDATRPQSTDSRIGHGAAANWHRRFGVLILAGRHVRPGGRIEEASVYDIAPTILALYGQPVPRSWPGRVLSDVLDPAFLVDHPVRFRDDDPPRRVEDGAAGEVVIGGTASRELLAKLESLGYISGGAGGADAITYRNNIGVSLMAEGRYAEAEAEFRAALETFPEHPMLRVNLGLCLRFLDRDDEAGVLFDAARKYPAAMRAAGQQMAQLAFDRGDLDGAEAVLRDVLAVEPEAADILTLLGQVRERGGDRDEAGRLYREAASRDPDAAPPRNHLGNLARRGGDDDAAERWYLEAIDADPYFMGSYNNLALVYQDRGDLQAAIDLYGRALSKSPTNAVVMNNLASLYYARGEIDAARDLWVRCTRADPRYPSPYNNLAGIAIGRGELDVAERLLDQALALDDDYGDAHINLSMVRRANGDIGGARAELEAAAADPRSRGRAWTSRGLLELEAGDPAAGVTWLERARGVREDDPGVLNLLGEAYYRLGRVEDAREAWERSLAVRPGQSDVRGALDRLP